MPPKTPDTPFTPAPSSDAFPDNPKAASIDRATGRPAELATGPTAPDPKISPDAAKDDKKDERKAPARSVFYGGGGLDGQTALPKGAVRDRNELRHARAEGVDIYTLGDPDFTGGVDRWQFSRTEPLYRAPLSGVPESVNADAAVPEPVPVADRGRPSRPTA